MVILEFQESDNGRRGVEFCVERGSGAGNTHLSTGVYIRIK